MRSLSPRMKSYEAKVCARVLWLSRNTTIEMIKDRGYSTTQDVLKYHEFEEKYPHALTKRTALNFIAMNRDYQAVIHFWDDGKLGKSAFEALLNQYEREGIFHIIIVLSQTPSPTVMSIARTAVKFTVEFFSIEELKFNKTKHQLVPAHRILSSNEREKILKDLNLDQSCLPKILKSDVIARYLGAKSGDIIEIIRKSRTAGVSTYYRLVIEKQK